MEQHSQTGAAPKPASAHTRAAHARLTAGLDFADDSCFADAQRGFVATLPDARIALPDGRVVWDLSSYTFLEQLDAPDSVNPSLWRLARLNRLHGLFQVCERVWQVRGFDLANTTIIEGDTGLIIIDTLTVCEAAAAALALYRQHRGDRPVRCVIYSHSHVDHYGGVEGMITPEQAASGEVEVIAPDGFLEAAISENVLAGVPMRRRAMFQFGPTLAPGPCSHVDAGLGKTMGRGTISLVAPNRLVTEPVETHVIDGVEIVFQLTPETEAPAEMNFFFPQFGVLNLAENGCHTMHNLCPLRGARTRDALAWSKYLDAALDAFIDRTDIVIAQHHWPTWGRERVRRFISEQRDLYRVLHDQSLRLMSHGLTPDEIAAEFQMPASLAARWHARPYYGALAHNLRAVYAHYMGPYDGHPASLDPLPPQATAERTIAYMGGADAVLARARSDFEAGDYRWVVQVGRHLVFAQPENRAARELLADAMEQLGYQSESSTWRNAYLLGAKELRHGPPKPGPGAVISRKVISMLPMEMFFDYLAIRVRPAAVDGAHLLLDWVMLDEDTIHRLTLSNSALSHASGSHGELAMARLSTDRKRLAGMVDGKRPLAESIAAGLLSVEGDAAAAQRLLDALDEFAPNFNILEP